MKEDIELKTHLRNVLVALGFRPLSKPWLFGIECEGNVGILHFAKSRFSSWDQLDLTPNLGVISRRLSLVFGPPVQDQIPQIFLHHWVRSSIYIHEASHVTAWDGLAPKDASTWVAAEADLRHRVVPALIDHLTDEGLRACWSTYKDPWLSPIGQLTYLALLLRELGPAGEYRAARAKLVRKVRAGGADTPGLALMAPGLRSIGVQLPDRIGSEARSDVGGAGR